MRAGDYLQDVLASRGLCKADLVVTWVQTLQQQARLAIVSGRRNGQVPWHLHEDHQTVGILQLGVTAVVCWQ